jgi:hypothetical protein
LYGKLKAPCWELCKMTLQWPDEKIHLVSFPECNTSKHPPLRNETWVRFAYLLLLSGVWYKFSPNARSCTDR